MSNFGMAWRLVASLTVIGFVAWQSPVSIGICLLLAMLTFQARLLARVLHQLQQTEQGRALTRRLRKLAIELAVGVVVNAAVIFGSMWASAALG